jgi:hypothetical protein
MTLSAKIIQADHDLETAADRASGKLAEHRWHWTLDETNPDRLGIREYARAVGRNHATISNHAHGWLDHLTTDRTVQDAVQIRSVKQADRDIVEAVAKATKTSIVNTRQHHRDDVDRVRNTVAEAREREDLTPDREREIIDRTAQNIAAGRKAEQASREQRKRSTPLQVLVIQGGLDTAKRALTKTLEDAKILDQDVLDEEFITGLREAIDRVVALAKLIQLALGGNSEINWDAELAKIAE